jgi:hypothetical protein
VSAHEPSKLDSPLTRAAQRLLIALFVLGITLPGSLLLLHDETATAKFEKRRLAPAPDLPRHKDQVRYFPIRFEAWFNDRFGFRDDFIRWHNLAQIKWLGTPPISYSGNEQLLANTAGRVSNQVIAGKSGWLFYAGEHVLEDYRGLHPFSDEELRRWAEVLQARHDWLAARGIPYIVIPCPEKTSIYPDYLPPAINRVGSTTRLDQLVAYCREHTTLELIDVRDAVRAARREDRVYHKTDTHWNQVGGFAAYQVMVPHLSAHLPGLVPVDRSRLDRRVSMTEGGDLAQMLGLADLFQEETIRLVLQDDRQGRIGSRRHQDGTIVMALDHPDKSLPRALIYHDSFLGPLNTFLAQHFSYAECRWTCGFDTQAVKRVKPDIVIQQFVERKLHVVTPENPSDLQAEVLRLAREKATKLE